LFRKIHIKMVAVMSLLAKILLGIAVISAPSLDLYGHVTPSMQKEATQALDSLFRPRTSAPYATLMLHQVDGEQNGEAHEVLFHGLLSGDADGARTHDLLRDRQRITLMDKSAVGVFTGYYGLTESCGRDANQVSPG
jgi:hypothetical protein